VQLTLVTDRRLCGADRLLGRVEGGLRGGVTAVQLREKDLDGGPLFRLAVELRRLTRAHQAQLLVNDRIDLALAVDADGVQLPGGSFRVDEARALLGPGKSIGVSTHSPEEIARAARHGADFAVFCPVFATASKAGMGPPQGLDRLRNACASASIPVIAIGGIDAATAALVSAAGVSGIAVISAILAVDDAAGAAREIAVARLSGKP